MTANRPLRALRTRVAKMLPRELTAWSYEHDADFILLKTIAEDRHRAQEKYLTFCAAARRAYITARQSFLDAEDTYAAAAEPFRVLAKIARANCA